MKSKGLIVESTEVFGKVISNTGSLCGLDPQSGDVDSNYFTNVRYLY